MSKTLDMRLKCCQHVSRIFDIIYLTGEHFPLELVLSVMDALPKTLLEAVKYFADSDNCREYLVARRWPNGVTCPTCGSTGRLLRQVA